MREWGKNEEISCSAHFVGVLVPSQVATMCRLSHFKAAHEMKFMASEYHKEERGLPKPTRLQASAAACALGSRIILIL